jgi:hypothetical protein
MEGGIGCVLLVVCCWLCAVGCVVLVVCGGWCKTQDHQQHCEALHVTPKRELFSWSQNVIIRDVGREPLPGNDGQPFHSLVS